LVFQKVSENVFTVVGRPACANVAAFVLPERVVLVDCGIRLSAVKEARGEIEEISGRKVELVILTHFHSDHTRALPAFSDCRIISSNLLLKNLKRAGRKPPEGFRLTFPNETFDDQLEIQDCDIQLIIKQTGGHTDGSTYIYCPNYKAIVAGDNLFLKPYYPWGGGRGCDPDVWVQALKEYLSLDAEYFIPGHGPVGGKDSVIRLLDYLNNVGNVMKEMIALRKNEDEVLRAGGEVKYYPSGARHPHISTLKKWYKIWRARIE
jgi:glyoxylase-like metal-dependent hydrolase (beta-lactamase superfamily II)